MLRIERLDDGDRGGVLVLAGAVAGPWVEELRRAVEAALARGAAVRLDLRDVTFVDHAGVTLLAGLAARDVTLRNGSPFVTELLKVRA
jgi:anti-anti-sigma regulatory factor